MHIVCYIIKSCAIVYAKYAENSDHSARYDVAVMEQLVQKRQQCIETILVTHQGLQLISIQHIIALLT